MSHTPGPWEAERTDSGGYRIIGEDKYAVGACQAKYRSHDDYATCAHNARLIAAAPDLLDAAKELCAAQDELPGSVRWQRADDLLRAAIAKASAP